MIARKDRRKTIDKTFGACYSRCMNTNPTTDRRITRLNKQIADLKKSRDFWMEEVTRVRKEKSLPTQAQIDESPHAGITSPEDYGDPVAPLQAASPDDIAVYDAIAANYHTPAPVEQSDHETWRAKLWELIDGYRNGHDWPLSMRGRIKAHIAKMPAPAPVAKGEPVYGPEYEAGNWSRRNYEAFMRDQGAAPAPVALTPERPPLHRECAMFPHEERCGECGPLSAPPAPAPVALTPAQMGEGLRQNISWATTIQAAAFFRGVRFAERAHGIKTASQEGGAA